MARAALNRLVDVYFRSKQKTIPWTNDQPSAAGICCIKIRIVKRGLASPSIGDQFVDRDGGASGVESAIPLSNNAAVRNIHIGFNGLQVGPSHLHFQKELTALVLIHKNL